MKTVHYVRVRKGVHWKQVLAIADNCMFLYELVPAPIGGWNLRKLEKQNHQWSGYTSDQILAFIERSPDPNIVPATEHDLVWLREQLPKVDARLELRPADYEACGQCGFDHEYEHDASQKAHERLP